MNAYQKSIQDIVKELQTNGTQGLSQKQAQERLKKDGPNRLPEGKTESWFTIFLSQFQSPLIYILLISAIIIFFVGDQKIDAFIISGILFFNAIIGTIQEGRTSNIIASLSRFIKTKSIVIRDGKKEIIDDADLVVGDLIVLREGERIPADARVIESDELHIDEAILTGESNPVIKTSDPLSSELVIGDQTNMVFKGTYVVSGSGLAIVTAIGAATQVGQLHKTLETIQTDIPLKKEVTRLSYFILIFAFAMCVLLLAIGLLFGHSFKELMVMLTALFICVIPEGLPVVLTLVLVTGAYRMAKQHVLIKNLQGVEALGRTDVIVIDKTGTLTRNEMVVIRVVTPEGNFTITGEGYFATGDVLEDGKKVEVAKDSALGQMAIASALMSDAELSYSEKLKLFEIKGDPTEAALSVFAQKLGIDCKQLCDNYKRVEEIPFDSQRKYHADFFEYNGSSVAYLIGAPEVIFKKVSTVPEAITHAFDEMLAKGLRIIALAKKDNPPSRDEQGIASDVQLLGICGIQDAIRPEVKAMVQQAREVGLQVIMATGDHKQTAQYVADEVGILRPGDQIVEGSNFAKLTDDQLLSQLNTTTVFSRVSPEDKARIVSLFHKQHKIVAMTGDGINDVPSLAAADLGIAMGRIGTEVTKQAADLVLLDDSFVNIIHAIEQGRHIFYTLRRVVLYFFATNMGEILIVLFALFTQLPLPLTAAQILWLNFVTDGFLDVGLAMEPQESDLLSANWLKKKSRLVDWNLIIKMMYFAIPMGVVSLIIFTWCYDGTPASIPYARTMTLVAMAMFQWFNAWNCRSERKSLFEIGLFANRWLIAATIFVLSLQFLLVYTPFLRYIFKTVPLSASDWGIIFGLSAPILLIEELRKLISRHIFGK